MNPRAPTIAIDINDYARVLIRKPPAWSSLPRVSCSYITVAATTEHYASGHVLAYAEAERKRGNAPVDRRARLVNGQYLKKAHKLDMKYNLTRTVNGTGHTSPSEFCAGKDS